jgi:hypothetical protein
VNFSLALAIVVALVGLVGGIATDNATAAAAAFVVAVSACLALMTRRRMGQRAWFERR